MKKILHIFTVLALMAGIVSGFPTYAVKHVVTVGNFFFNPTSLNVTVGDTVRWVWSAGNHTTTSNPGGIPSGAASWDELITSTHLSYEYKVTVAGTYNYVCTPHAPGMAGSFTATAFTPTLSVSPSNRSVPASAGSTTFTVTSNSSWSVSSNATWCTVTPGGTGNGTITANYAANATVVQRIATITINVTGLPVQTVTVTQSGAAPLLTVGPSNQNVPAPAGTTTFTISSNTEWMASSNAAWCTVDPSGSGNSTITATFTANNTTFVRIATITITVAGLAPQTVTVTQAAFPVGIPEQQSSGLQVYPNPTSGYFKIRNGMSKEQECEVTVSDMSGKQILSRTCSGSSECSFDLSGEPGGYYFIRVSQGTTTEVRRIIVTD